MTPALWIAAALGVVALVVWAVRGMRAAAEREDAAEAAHTARLLMIAGMTARIRAMTSDPAPEPDPLTLDRLRRRALGGRDRGAMWPS